MILDKDTIKQIVAEITDMPEKNRRAEMLRRHTMYKDGGKVFLIDQVRKEFNEDAVKEMRLCPINVLKKIINMKSMVYKKSPIRRCMNPDDQVLVEYYADELSLDIKMQKANRFYNLFANCEIYVRKDEDGDLCLDIIPPYLYSLSSNPMDLNKIDAKIFSAFSDQSEMTVQKDLPSATGVGLFNTDKSYVSNEKKVSTDGVRSTKDYIRYMIWTAENYCVTDYKGNVIDAADEDLTNPIGMIPSVTLAKDRDNETYSTVGADIPDLTLTIQMGWSDLNSIAKHQGYSLLTMTGPEAPEKMVMGLNRVIWMKTKPDEPTPTISYVTAASPLAEYKDLLVEQLAMLLSSNDLNPQSVGGTFSANGSGATSGFHAMINSSDTIEAINMDKPVLKNAEEELWEIIVRYHNYLFDAGQLTDEAKALGKFSEDFEIDIRFPDVRPMQSETDMMAIIKEQMALGILSKKQALQKLNPDMTDEQIDQLMTDIAGERDAGQQAQAQKMMTLIRPKPVIDVTTEDKVDADS
jgi:hypothetical protein